MASLKDLIVMGPARFLDKLYGNLEGNATSANKWSTPRSFTIGKTARSVDGSINVAWTYNEIGASVSNAWGAGTTAGPTLTTTVNGVASTAVAIPSASTSASGIVTTGEQSFTGVKKFASIVYANSGLYIGSNANGDNNFITFYGTTGDGPGSYNHTFIGENLYGGSEGSELVLFKGNDIDNNGGGSPGPDRIRHIAARHVFQTYDTALSGGWTTICDSTAPATKLEIRPNLIRAYTTTSINTDTADYSLNTNSFICDSWVRTKGNTGWYNETHQGGWYMTDTTWIRAYNDKPVYISNISTAALYTAGGVKALKGFTNEENGVTTTINSYNSSWTHYQTNSPSGHWFNKSISVAGNIYAGSTYSDLVLTTANYSGYLDSRYLKLAGGTMDGTAIIKWADSGNWSNSNSGVTFPVVRGGLEWYGQSDWVKIFAEETGNDNLNLVCQFGDDATPALIFRNKDGTQVAKIGVDGIITATTFSGSLSGNASTASILKGTTSTSVPLTQNSAGYISYAYNINKDSTGNMPHNNNANGVLTINTHTGEYQHQLGFSSDGSVYHRSTNGGALTTSLAWNKILTTGNYTGTLDSRYLKLAGGTMAASAIIKFPASAGTIATSDPMAITYGRISAYGTLYINANTDNSGTEYVVLTAGKGLSSSASDGLAVGTSTLTWQGSTVLTSGNYSGHLDDRYVNVSGDTLNNGAQISRAGKSQSWVNGRDGALIRTTSVDGYSPIISMKTVNGSWEFGTYNYSGWEDKITISYVSDSNYPSNNAASTYTISTSGYFSGSCSYANSAGTLSSALGVDKGGTGATTKLNAKTNLGISYGTTLPTSGMSEGDIFFKIG